MANKKNWLGLLVMVLAFGIVVIGCDNGSTDNGGGGGDLRTKLIGEWKADNGDICNFKGNPGNFMTFGSYNVFHTTWTITSLTENKVIAGQRDGSDTISFNFVLSENDQTLTVSNFQRNGASADKGNGVFKKQPKQP
jgi:hypothetical protein